MTQRVVKFFFDDGQIRRTTFVEPSFAKLQEYVQQLYPEAQNIQFVDKTSGAAIVDDAGLAFPQGIVAAVRVHLDNEGVVAGESAENSPEVSAPPAYEAPKQQQQQQQQQQQPQPHQQPHQQRSGPFGQSAGMPAAFANMGSGLMAMLPMLMGQLTNASAAAASGGNFNQQQQQQQQQQQPQIDPSEMLLRVATSVPKELLHSLLVQMLAAPGVQNALATSIVELIHGAKQQKQQSQQQQQEQKPEESAEQPLQQQQQQEQQKPVEMVPEKTEPASQQAPQEESTQDQRIVEPDAERDSESRSVSEPAVEASPESQPEPVIPEPVDQRIVTLENMGFTDQREKLVALLTKHKGNLEAVVQALLG